MSVRIGINPITWSNDDMPELGGNTPLETCLAEASRAGYAGIELGNKFPRDSAILRPILDRHALRLISGWYSGRLRERSVRDEISAVKDHLTLLSDLGCAIMVFAETCGSIAGSRGMRLSKRPALAAKDWAEFGHKLTAVAEHLAERGVHMAFHHHMGTVVETEAEIDRLIENTGKAVGLLLDTGHLVYSGGDARAVATRHAGRINHIHCKDIRKPVLTRAKAADLSFLDAVVDGVFTVPGDGFIDYPSILAVLESNGYEGWLVVEAEQDPAKAHPLTYATKGYQFLHKAAIHAGMTVVP